MQFQCSHSDSRRIPFNPNLFTSISGISSNTLCILYLFFFFWCIVHLEIAHMYRYHMNYLFTFCIKANFRKYSLFNELNSCRTDERTVQAIGSEINKPTIMCTDEKKFRKSVQFKYQFHIIVAILFSSFRISHNCR